MERTFISTTPHPATEFLHRARSVVEIWVWPRTSTSSYAQFLNVTITVGATYPGTDTTCATGLTPVNGADVVGPMKVACASANGTNVQHILFVQYRTTVMHLSIVEVLILRDGELLRLCTHSLRQ